MIDDLIKQYNSTVKRTFPIIYPRKMMSPILNSIPPGVFCVMFGEIGPVEFLMSVYFKHFAIISLWRMALLLKPNVLKHFGRSSVSAAKDENINSFTPKQKSDMNEQILISLIASALSQPFYEDILIRKAHLSRCLSTASGELKIRSL